MTLTRRRMMMGGAGVLTLAACGGGPAEPGFIAMSATMAAGANPAPDGTDRPLVVTLVQLRGTDAFDAADVIALQDPNTSLAADLVRTEQVVLSPGGSAAKSIPVEQGAKALGIIAGYRDPSGKIFRTTTPLPASGDVPVVIAVTPAGLKVS